MGNDKEKKTVSDTDDLSAFIDEAVKDQGVGVETNPLGMHVSTAPIEQYRGAKGVRDRIGVLVEKSVTTYTHWEAGVGRFYCFRGQCCKRNGAPDARHVVPIVVYPTNAEAEIVKGKIAIKYLKIDTEKYEYFENLRRGNVDPRDFDHIVSCSDTQYQKLHFSKIEGEKAAWQRNDKTRGRVIKLFKDVAMYMLPDVARTLTEEEYLQKVGAAPAVEQQASGVDLDDMLGEDD